MPPNRARKHETAHETPLEHKNGRSGNPFVLYPTKYRTLAIANGIVKSVSLSLGLSKPAVSKVFSGDAPRPKPRVVRSLNYWLEKRGLPAAAKARKPVANLGRRGGGAKA